MRLQRRIISVSLLGVCGIGSLHCAQQSPAHQRRVEIARAVMDEASKLHIATDYLSACSIANGHGWSLCQLLADLLDHSIRHLKVSEFRF